MRNVTYSDLIKAYADGKTVEFADSYVNDCGWYALEADNTEVLQYFMRTDGHTEGRFQFRLKPRTVKIGSREVEAPVLEPKEGERLWYVNADGQAYSLLFNPSDVGGEVDSGRAFASKEAALSAFSAVTLLLRGEA